MKRELMFLLGAAIVAPQFSPSCLFAPILGRESFSELILRR